jgi:RNA polymerase sigma-70 factor (ECF subfamily)
VEPDGDEFERFFASEYDRTLRSVRATTGAGDYAVDATQDAFIKAHLHWQVVRDHESPAGWVRRAAINACRDRERAERRRRGREAAIGSVELAAESPAHERLEADDSARGLLGQLAPGQREIATMYYVEDRSVDDIATTLGVSAGTVKSQLSEARQRLRRLHRR